MRVTDVKQNSVAVLQCQCHTVLEDDDPGQRDDVGRHHFIHLHRPTQDRGYPIVQSQMDGISTL
jgi:hypothetical protein